LSHFFTIFGDEALGDLLVRLDDEDAADILEGISPDDATDISTDVEPTVGQGTIVQVEPADVAEIRELMAHPPETAGGITSPAFVAISPDVHADHAVAALSFTLARMLLNLPADRQSLNRQKDWRARGAPRYHPPSTCCHTINWAREVTTNGM
jgi:hypothetical protein